MKTKMISYSYPSSPNADAMGFKGGCYTVEMTDGLMIRALAGFAQLFEAQDYADSIDLPWNKYTVVT